MKLGSAVFETRATIADIGHVTREACTPEPRAPARPAPSKLLRPSCPNVNEQASSLGPIHLFDLAAQQARWLSASQAAIAGNIANANTPGYQTQAVRPFAEILDHTQLDMAATSGSHLGVDDLDPQIIKASGDAGWEITESGNSVSLEQEMIKAGDVHRDYALNTSIVKAFHGMLMASVRS